VVPFGDHCTRSLNKLDTRALYSKRSTQPVFGRGSSPVSPAAAGTSTNPDGRSIPEEWLAGDLFLAHNLPQAPPRSIVGPELCFCASRLSEAKTRPCGIPNPCPLFKNAKRPCPCPRTPCPPCLLVQGALTYTHPSPTYCRASFPL